MTITRKILEKNEDSVLAPVGTRSRDTKGREHTDKEPRYRTTFQRDRDRILHTTAFRRLEYKTQVFVNFEGDYFRTRLTHTLEVAQMGRTIARALGANEDLIEAICLAHDLGHAAFGHSGERTLNSLLKKHGGFDHNKQSFRIVTELERRYPDFPGLNLTWEVREGIVKHETEYDVSDAEDFDPELRGGLEAQIANAADELAYTTHDLDDGLRSGMITPKMLAEVEIWRILLKKLKLGDGPIEELDRHRTIRKLVGIFISDVVEATAARIKESGANSSLAIQKLDHNVIGLSKDMQKQHEELKSFLYKNLYSHHRVLRMAHKAEMVLTSLFNAYIDQPEMLPLAFRTSDPKRGTERTIADYLAGMTDRYAIQEYERIFDPRSRP